MRTLNQSGYMNQGVRPVAFVRIADAADTTLLLQAAKTVGDWEDRITTFGPINQSITPEGGMAEVSGAEVRRLILDEELKFCTEASLAPKIEVVTLAAGRFIAESAVGGSYASVRDAASGFWASVGLVIGRQYDSIYPLYRHMRAILEYTVPADLTNCEYVGLDLTGLGDFSDIDFDLKVVEGNWTNVSQILMGLAYNNFEGWEESGDYTLAQFNETWNTSEYVNGHNYIRGNAAFRAFIESKAGQTVRLMLISEKDSNWTDNGAGPSGNEFVQFESSSAKLELRYNSITLDNQKMEIMVGLEPLPSVLDRTTLDVVWTGVCDDYVIDDREMTAKGRQNDFKKDRVIPGRLIRKADWPDCPEENIGKPYPIVYGAFDMTGLHKQGVGRFTATAPAGADKEYSYPDPIKGLVVAKKDYDRTVLYAGHDLGLPVFMVGYPIFSWNPELKCFEMFPCDASGSYSAGTGYIEELSTKQKNNPFTTYFPDALCNLNYTGVAMILPIRYDAGGYDADNVFDSDGTNYATLTGDFNQIIIYFDDKNNKYTTALFLKAEFLGGADPSKFELDIYRNEAVSPENADSWNPLVVGSTPFTGDGEIFVAFSTLESLTRVPMDLTQYYFKLNKTDGTGSIKLYAAAGFVTRDASNETALYKSGTYVYGRRDDASGTITGVNGGMIENPSHVIESIARDEMSLAAAEIDTAALDTLATAQGTAKLAFQLLERDRSREVLSKIGKESRTLLWWDELDRLTGKAFDSAEHFASSGTDIPGNDDIFTITGDPASGVFTTHPIMDGPVISKRAMNDVKNDFVLKYKKNLATGEYTEVLTCDKDGTNVNDAHLSGTTGAALEALCQESYDLIGSVNTLEIECEFIRDEATAARTLQHLVEWFAKRRYILSFLADIDATAFELGDVINVRDDRIYDLFGTAVTNRKKWMIQKLDPDLNRFQFRIEAIEL